MEPGVYPLEQSHMQVSKPALNRRLEAVPNREQTSKRVAGSFNEVVLHRRMRESSHQANELPSSTHCCSSRPSVLGRDFSLFVGHATLYVALRDAWRSQAGDTGDAERHNMPRC